MGGHERDVPELTMAALEARLEAMTPEQREASLRVAVEAAHQMERRDRCGCHSECSIFPHRCDRPCVWPQCLTTAGRAELASEITWPSDDLT